MIPSGFSRLGQATVHAIHWATTVLRPPAAWPPP
jgi:hypothetical protein